MRSLLSRVRGLGWMRNFDSVHHQHDPLILHNKTTRSSFTFRFVGDTVLENRDLTDLTILRKHALQLIVGDDGRNLALASFDNSMK